MSNQKPKFSSSERSSNIIWSIIKCPMIDQGGLWAIRAFCEWSFFCLLMYPLWYIFYSIYKSRNLKVIPAYDRSYNSNEWSEAKIFIIWAIIKCPMIDQSRWFMSDQCNLWANSAHRVFFVQFLSSCLEISCLHIPSDNNYRIFIYFSMSIHKMCLSDQTCIN